MKYQVIGYVYMLLLLKICRGIHQCKFSFKFLWVYAEEDSRFSCYGIPMFLCCSYAWTLGVFHFFCGIIASGDKMVEVDTPCALHCCYRFIFLLENKNWFCSKPNMDICHTFVSFLANKEKGFGFGFNGEIVSKIWNFGFYVGSCGVVGTVGKICGDYHW
jgi:hypothetical protein